MRSPEVHAESVLQGLATMLALPEAKNSKVKATLETRRCNDDYDHERFQNTVNMRADTFHLDFHGWVRERNFLNYSDAKSLAKMEMADIQI